jgi:drug/metabolite transporter (DMT)-like permease
MNPDPQTIGVLYATAASLAWTVFSFTMKMSLRDSPVLKVAAGVNGLNALFVTAVAFYFVSPADFLPKSTETTIYLVLAGVLHIGLARVFFYTSIQRIGPNRAVPLALSYPVITALLASVMLGEVITLKIFLGLALLLGGIFLIVGAEPPRRETGPPESFSWRAFGWACAGITSLLWGIAAVFFKKATFEMPSMAVSSIALWLGFSVAFLIARVLEPQGRLTARSWRWLLASAALQTIAIPCYTLAFTQTLAVRVTAIISIQPLFAIPIGWLVMREAENITPRLVGGAALTVAGTILVIS